MRSAFVGTLGFVVQLGEGSLADGIGDSQNVLAGLGPALVSGTDSPRVMLVSGAKKLVRAACRGGV